MFINKDFFRKFIKPKYVFKKPRENKLLIFDLVGSENIIEVLGKNIKFSILCTRFEELNLYVILILIKKNILNLKWDKLSFRNYLIEYIKLSNPKAIITFIDNNPVFFKLKKIFPKINFMCVQNGTSIVGMDQEITRNLLKIDIFFCFSDYFGQIYKKRLAKRTVTVGSLKANKEKKIYSNTFKYKDIIFISQFKNFKKIKYVNKNIDYDKFYLAENKLIPILYDFCMQKNIKLIICMRNENYEIEKKFYKKILFNFLKRKNLKNLVFHSQNLKNSSYKILRKSRVITCIDSSLGLESLGLGHKTIFFSLRSKFLKEKKLYFGWPKKLKFNGFCWINYYSKKKIYSLLNSVYKLNRSNWNKNLKNSNIVDIMYHDHKNKLIKNNIATTLK